MKRLATILLLAALSQGLAWSADLYPRPMPPLPTLPTTPRVPAPTLDAGGGVVQASGSSRLLPPLRVRTGVSAAPAEQSMPLPTGYSLSGGNAAMPPHAGYPATGCAGGNCAGPDCGTASRSTLSRLKAWLCFQPTTGDALPKLRPQPYIGKVLGTFRCSSAGCGGAYGGAAGCGNAVAGGGIGARGGAGGNEACGAAGAGGVPGGRFGSLLSGRGCRGGGCVPPADDAIPGYRFSTAPQPTTGYGPVAPSTGYLSYKPAQPAAVNTQPPADPLARPFTRP
jgi:hypothetical protein